MLLIFLHTEEAFVLIERASKYDCHSFFFSSLNIFVAFARALFYLILSSIFPVVLKILKHFSLDFHTSLHFMLHHGLGTNRLFRNLAMCLFLSSFRMSYNSSTHCSGSFLTFSGTRCHIEFRRPGSRLRAFVRGGSLSA